jgi:hypothetical protein
MAIIIDSTVGGPAANSYISLAEANAFHLTSLDSVAWDDADNDQRARALLAATRLLESSLTWIGSAVSSAQALSWPRYGARTRTGYLFDPTVIPNAVKEATAELARLLLAGATTVAANDLKSLKAGPVNLVFTEAAANAEQAALPDSVYQMVRFLAIREPESGSGIRAVQVLRT